MTNAEKRSRNILFRLRNAGQFVLSVRDARDFVVIEPNASVGYVGGLRLTLDDDRMQPRTVVLLQDEADCFRVEVGIFSSAGRWIEQFREDRVTVDEVPLTLDDAFRYREKRVSGDVFDFSDIGTKK